MRSSLCFGLLSLCVSSTAVAASWPTFPIYHYGISGIDDPANTRFVDLLKLAGLEPRVYILDFHGTSGGFIESSAQLVPIHELASEILPKLAAGQPVFLQVCRGADAAVCVRRGYRPDALSQLSKLLPGRLIIGVEGMVTPHPNAPPTTNGTFVYAFTEAVAQPDGTIKMETRLGTLTQSEFNAIAYKPIGKLAPPGELATHVHLGPDGKIYVTPAHAEPGRVVPQPPAPGVIIVPPGNLAGTNNMGPVTPPGGNVLPPNLGPIGPVKPLPPRPWSFNKIIQGMVIGRPGQAAPQTGMQPAAAVLTGMFFAAQDRDILQILTALTGGRCEFKFEDVAGQPMMRKLLAKCEPCPGQVGYGTNTGWFELNILPSYPVNWFASYNSDPVKWLSDKLIASGLFPEVMLEDTHNIYAQVPFAQFHATGLAIFMTTPLEVGYIMRNNGANDYFVLPEDRCLIQTNSERKRQQFLASLQAGTVTDQCYSLYFPAMMADWNNLQTALASDCGSGLGLTDPDKLKDLRQELFYSLRNLHNNCFDKIQALQADFTAAHGIDYAQGYQELTSFLNTYAHTSGGPLAAANQVKLNVCDSSVLSCSALTSQLNALMSLIGSARCSNDFGVSVGQNGPGSAQLMQQQIALLAIRAIDILGQGTCGNNSDAQRALDALLFLDKTVIVPSLAAAGGYNATVNSLCMEIYDRQTRLESDARKCSTDRDFSLAAAGAYDPTYANPTRDYFSEPSPISYEGCLTCCLQVAPTVFDGTNFGFKDECMKRCLPLNPMSSAYVHPVATSVMSYAPTSSVSVVREPVVVAPEPAEPTMAARSFVEMIDVLFTAMYNSLQ